MADRENDAEFVGYDSFDDDELLEDTLENTHVDLPDPDDPGSETKGDAAAPRKRWRRIRDSESG